MTIEELRNHVFHDQKLQDLLKSVVVRSIASQFEGVIVPAFDTSDAIPWNYLLTIASLLSESNDSEQQDAALRVAQFCITNSACSELQKAAASVILDDMANRPAIELAINRQLISPDLESQSPFGVRARLLRNRLKSTVDLADSTQLRLTRFQYAFWKGLESAKWVSVSAPTSAGKSFLVTRWLVNSFSRDCGLTIYIVPTRALISQTESSLKEYAKSTKTECCISTIPRGENVAPGRPTILVLTQERAHLLLTQGGFRGRVSHVVVDEAQKIGDRHRGVLLQQVIEMLVENNPNAHVTFISPMTDNPAELFRDAPDGATKLPITSENVTVNQNLLWVTQNPRKVQEWTMHTCYRGDLLPIGNFRLSSKPDVESKRLPFVSYLLSNRQGGNIVYVNRAADAEKLALQLYDLVGNSSPITETDELAELASLVKDVIHNEYTLAKVLERGIAFHYGNIPQLVRTEVERLFSDGKIRFLVCTSTLIEGVNTSCKTICVRGPKKGNGRLMTSEDFWNLAGRAGRLGREFQGNIVCVDANKAALWNNGSPPKKRGRYFIERTTDEILSNVTELIKFCDDKAPRAEAQSRPDLEYVLTYLMLTYRKYGDLGGARWARHYDKDTLVLCSRKMKEAWEGVELPLEVAARNPGINPMAMQRLLAYFRDRTHNKKKSVEELLPADPASDDSKDSYGRIMHRCAEYLNAALGPAGKRSFVIGALITYWMRGYPLSRLISRRVELEEMYKEKIALPRIIREVLDDVDRIARFEAPRTITAYLDVLRHFLHESGNATLAAEIEDVGLYLELGVSIPTHIALLGLGLSRSTAIQLAELLSNDSMSEDEVRVWLQNGTWESASLSPLVKREIRKALILVS